MKTSKLLFILSIGLICCPAITKAQLTVTITTTNCSCNGMCDGSATASPSGGIAPYTYMWDDPNFQSIASATALCPGTYTVIVMDNAGDTISASATITEPSAVVLSVSAVDETCTNCCDGYATVIPSGGTSPYTYSWNDSLMQTNATATALCSGTVCATVTDANGCAETVCVTITASGCTLSASASSTNVTTCGGSDGTATVSPSGGTIPYTYSWSNGATTQSITNLSAGTYTATVTDSAGCTSTASTVVSDLGSITLSMSSVDENCFNCCDGSAAVVASGGTTPYTYLWSDSSVASTVSNLCSGTYCVTVTDNNGCTANGCVTVSDSGACSSFTASFSSTTASCGNCDGTATASPSGGTSPYTYLWNDPSIQTNAVATGLCAGTYSVTIADAAGCTSANSVSIGTGASFTVSISTLDESCLGACDGSATATVSGGTSPYTYNWSDSVSTVATANNLCSNVMYSLTVLDANGCAGYADSILIGSQSSVSATVTSTNASCGMCDGSATINGTGGLLPYTYSWSNGATTQSVSSLCAGVYGVTLTDAAGCAGVYSVLISSTASFSVNVTTVDDCSNNCSGSATATPSGGTPPYTYEWSDSTTSSTATGLCYNMLYTVMVTDVSGCSVTATIDLVCDSVWPGDANDDNIANNLDILAIGVGSGSTGPVRPGATINWVAQEAANWTNSLSNGANYKHVDCNGDGTINDADTTAVITNYGFTHNKTTPQPAATAADPELILNVLTDTVGLNTTVTVSVELGTSSVPANSVYGLAFTINFNSSLIDTSSLQFNFSGSWLGNMGTDLIGIAYKSPSNGLIDVGVSRTDQSNISGNGQIGLFTFVTTDSMPSGPASTLDLSLANVTLISSNESVVPVNLSSDSVVVTGIRKEISLNNLSIGVYPNPFSTTTTVRIDGLNTKRNISLDMYNVIGEKVRTFSSDEGKFVVDRNQLPSGIYFYNIKSDNKLIGAGKLVVN